MCDDVGCDRREIERQAYALAGEFAQVLHGYSRGVIMEGLTSSLAIYINISSRTDEDVTAAINEVTVKLRLQIERLRR